MADPQFMSPFIIQVEPVEPERSGNVDLYLPAGDGPVPLVVFVHGGPLPPEVQPRPREWPVFRGYAALAVSRGVAALVLDHSLETPADYPRAAAEVTAAVEAAAADPRIDGERVAVWSFSGGSLMTAEWLRKPPGWLRVLALTYPLLGTFPGMEVDPAYRPIEAVAGAGGLPIVLSRAGQDNPFLLGLTDEFVAAAGAAGVDLELIDVPNGVHAFDMAEDTEESRAAVERAFAAVLTRLSA